jgi:Schlafen, AlbA_2
VLQEWLSMDSKSSRASELFQTILSQENPAQYLSDLAILKKAETDFLEFKGASRIQDKQVKEYWSQALSGFANTEGGILVWGIRASRIRDPFDPSSNVDAATALDLVPNPRSFAQMLKDVRLEATVDPIAGVDLAHYDTGSGEGFVICLIPESSQKPHRAQLVPARQYYQRIGDSFTIIPHSLLRSLFFPQLHPRLEARIIVRFRREQEKGLLDFECSLCNNSLASARNLDAYVHINRPFVGASAKDSFSLDYRIGSSGIGLSVMKPLHPGKHMGMFTCTYSEPITPGNLDGSWSPTLNEITFRIYIHMMDQEAQVLVATIPESDLKPNRVVTSIRVS